MDAQAIILLIPMLTLLVVAAVIDALSRRIPNWLTAMLAAGGIVCSFAAGAPVSPLMSVLGLLTGFALLLAPFALGAMGGGDVKLVAAIGAWVGASVVFQVFLIAAILGMCIAIAQSIQSGRLRQLMSNSLLLSVNILNIQHVGKAHVMATGQSARSIDKPLPYAVPVLGAVVILVLMGPLF